MADFDMANHPPKKRRNSRRPSRNGLGRRAPSGRNSDRAFSNGQDFKPRNPGRGNSRGSSRRDFRPRRDEDKTPTMVTCDGCGKSCEVPFKPSSKKPVYCDDCFKNNKTAVSEIRSKASTTNLDQINKKLDKILDLLKEN
jgi:CxxC-x17-CxxC domain-containing protein